MEDYSKKIRILCQGLYENIKFNSSVFLILKSNYYLKTLKKINKQTEFKYIYMIRDELGLVYRNYLIFSAKKEYETNLKTVNKIKKLYIELSKTIRHLSGKNGIKLVYPEYSSLEKYINTLENTYGGQTEKYIKKLSKKKIEGKNCEKTISNIYKDSQLITSEKKRAVINIIQSRIDCWKQQHKKESKIKIGYNYKKAEYILINKGTNGSIKKKKYKFKSNFSDIKKLQQIAMKNLRKLNFGISLYDELGLKDECIKYIDPFILTIFVEEGYLDYAKLYLSQINGENPSSKYELPFKIVYVINENPKKGALTPVRNEIISMIAERHSVSVADLKIEKNVDERKLQLMKRIS